MVYYTYNVYRVINFQHKLSSFWEWNWLCLLKSVYMEKITMAKTNLKKKYWYNKPLARINEQGELCFSVINLLIAMLLPVTIAFFIGKTIGFNVCEPLISSIL